MLEAQGDVRSFMARHLVLEDPAQEGRAEVHPGHGAVGLAERLDSRARNLVDSDSRAAG